MAITWLHLYAQCTNICCSFFKYSHNKTDIFSITQIVSVTLDLTEPCRSGAMLSKPLLVSMGIQPRNCRWVPASYTSFTISVQASVILSYSNWPIFGWRQNGYNSYNIVVIWFIDVLVCESWLFASFAEFKENTTWWKSLPTAMAFGIWINPWQFITLPHNIKTNLVLLFQKHLFNLFEYVTVDTEQEQSVRIDIQIVI